MKSYFTQLMWVCTLLLCYCTLQGQLNPANQYFDVLPGDTLIVDIHSDEIIKPCWSCDVYDGTLAEIQNVENVTKLTIVVNESFLGQTTLPVEYYQVSGFFYKKSLQTSIHINVVESVIDLKHDYISTIPGQQISVDVLANDFTSHPPLTIKSISLSENGSASIQNGVVSFVPEDVIKGMGYIRYTAENAVGLTKSGSASICILNPDVSLPIDTLRFSYTGSDPLPILLPSDGFEFVLNQEPTLGAAHFIGADVLEYTKPTGVSGLDEFHLIDNDAGLVRVVMIDNLDLENRQAIRDDEIYTFRDQTVNFNVYKNDLKQNPIISYSDELSFKGNGVFSYNPPKGFSGYKLFEYETKVNAAVERAQIVIYINDFIPESRERYDFVTRQNQALVLNYAIPLDDYSFVVSAEADNGSIFIFDGNASFSNDCGQDNGLNLVIYTPDDGFVGTDEFELRYCPGDNNCEVLKVEMEVIPFEENCGCIGQDCVWPGDLDNNGEVSVEDILSLGYGIGLTGDTRNENDNNFWIAQNGSDWSSRQFINGNNAKYLDANGDGLVTLADTLAVSESYQKQHNFLPAFTPVQRDFPFTLELSDHNPEVGDLLEIKVNWGAEYYPVTDVHGLAYSLNLNPAFYDTTAVQVDYDGDGWLKYNSPMINMFQQPNAGRMDLVSSRTTGATVSGNGLIHTLGIIVIEDHEGFRLSDDEIEVPVKLTNIRFTNGAGQMFSAPDYETSFTLNLSNPEPETPEEEDLFVFPNPSNGDVHYYLNGNVINEISIFDISGKAVHSIINLNTQSYKMDISNLPDGLYISQVKTANGIINTKIQKQH